MFGKNALELWSSYLTFYSSIALRLKGFISFTKSPKDFSTEVGAPITHTIAQQPPPPPLTPILHFENAVGMLIKGLHNKAQRLVGNTC